MILRDPFCVFAANDAPGSRLRVGGRPRIVCGLETPVRDGGRAASPSEQEMHGLRINQALIFLAHDVEKGLPMSDEISPQKALEAKAGQKIPDRIYLVSYPKIVFLYPSLIAAILAAIVTGVRGNVEDNVNEIVSLIFLGIFCANLVVLSFDFPRTTSLTIFFLVVAAFFGIWLLSTANPDFLPAIGDFAKNLRPYANANFYGILSTVLVLIFIGVAISVQFDYWEVRPNELLHHHGVLSDLKRFSAPNLRIDKEINDLFEYLLLRAGRLILHPSNERRAIVLENVFFINRKEQQITKMLGALQVQVRDENQSM